MQRRILQCVLTVLNWALIANRVFAEMPAVDPDALARARVQNISFFLFLFLLCSFGVQWIWNGLRRDFPRLPRLSYRTALGVVTLWGLLFLIVLTMISGARELMTPGAWKKTGFTYRLAEEPPQSSAQTLDRQRRAKLTALREALWNYAYKHGGHFPPNDQAPEIPAQAWELPDAARMRYFYVPGRVVDRGSLPLAYEPGLFGRERLVLLTDGSMTLMSEDAIRLALDPRGAK
jgi:hypothetical protein